ncbi:MAG: hypothetical protein IJW30_01675 [Clostridia bacterium]|nr:hypothetical protein [Clostridia bacterium]
MAQFTNQAQLSYNDRIVNSNVAVGEILEVLSAAKTAVTTTYTAGDDVTYVISAINTGATPITGLTVSDDLGGFPRDTEILYPLTYKEGSARLYINGVLQAAPTVTAGPPLTFVGITIPAGGNMVLVYEALTNQFSPLDPDGSITNTATVTANGITTPIVVSETVTPAAESDLTITKSIEPPTVVENGTVTYRFVIRNYGNVAADADANVSVTDVFDPVLYNLTASLEGEALVEGTDYTYVQADGLFATVPGRITVPAATFTQDVQTGAWITVPGTVTLTVSGNF